uniref:Uncharacterized protein n=1 Tax=Setaria italica TaxID=4555 RepID=K4ANM1_SETIT
MVTSQVSWSRTTSRHLSILPALPQMMLWRVCHEAMWVWQKKPSMR